MQASGRCGLGCSWVGVGSLAVPPFAPARHPGARVYSRPPGCWLNFHAQFSQGVIALTLMDLCFSRVCPACLKTGLCVGVCKKPLHTSLVVKVLILLHLELITLSLCFDICPLSTPHSIDFIRFEGSNLKICVWFWKNRIFTHASTPSPACLPPMLCSTRDMGPLS